MHDNTLKVLGISGSPRKGNSLFLLERAIEAAKKVKICQVEGIVYSLKGKRFAPCIHCNKCNDLEGECAQRDDFQELRDLWFQSDVIIYSVPVYHMAVPGQLKCFFDRLGHTARRRTPNTLPLKVVGLMAQGACSYCGQETTLVELLNHALIMEAIPVTVDVGAGAGAIGIGTWTRWSSERNALQRHSQHGDQETNSAVTAAENLAKRAVELAWVMHLGISAAKERLKKIPDNPASILRRLFLSSRSL